MKLSPLFPILMLAAVTGCSSKAVTYGDAKETETVSIAYGSTDLQGISDKMAESLLSSPALAEISVNGRPVLFMDYIRNKTAEHIDTEAISDTLRTKLLQSGKFRFVDMSIVSAMKAQLNYQQGSGMIDPATRVAIGKQTGARYMVYGNLISIEKSNDQIKDRFYQMTMNLVDLQSGEILWADQKEIRKQEERSTFGW